MVDKQKADLMFKLRRERGRRAQRAYRNRQLETARRLEQQNASLRDALQTLISSSQDPAKPKLRTVLQDAKRLVDSQENQQTRPAKSPTQPIIEQDRPDVDNTSSSQPNEYPTTEVTENWRDSNSLINRTGRFSPRLTYGLWLEPERHIHINSPPPDIVPFLGPGADTFGAAVYWRAMGIAFATGKKLQQQGGEVQRFLQPIEDQILAIPFHIDGVDTLLKRVEARLWYRRYGTLDIEHPGRDPDTAIRLHHKVLALLKERAVPVHEFLGMQDVESYLRHRLGVSEFAKLETALTGHQDGPAAILATRLVGALAPLAICLGDGPRLRMQTMVDTVNSIAAGTYHVLFAGPLQREGTVLA